VRPIEERAAQAYRARFYTEPEVIASAPGRVNLIGEHTDYAGGFVLPCAIDRRVAVAMGIGDGPLYTLDFDVTRPRAGPKEGAWVDYPRGVAWAMAEAGLAIPPFQAAFTGDVPTGSGLSSSAAIEAATALALSALAALGQSRQALAVLCQRAENAFVGVSSGIMDQYASLLCAAGMALLIDCRSLEAEQVPLDLDRAGLSLLVCDTRVKRELARTSAYNERRQVCERAARTLGILQLRDARPGDLDRLTGEEHTRARARHVISENARVLEAVAALRGQQDFATFGRLMYASHASLRDDYEVSTPELDAFVEVAAETGAVGARLTGAGFGGCAIALIASDRAETLAGAAAERFAVRGFATPACYTFHPSAGAEVVR
jgi:galactokinase